MARIHWLGLAVSLGITWGLLVLLIGWAAMLFNWGDEAVEVLASIYIGYGPTFLGSVIGLLWGFFDGAFAGVIISLIYNVFVPKSRTSEG